MDSTFKKSVIINKIESKNNHQQPYYFELINDLSQCKTVYLSIINPSINEININIDDTNIILGDKYRFTKREFKHCNVVYPITLKPYENKKISIVIKSQWQPLIYKIILSNENKFIKITNHDSIFLGFFFGVYFLYLMLLLSFYFFSKSKHFLTYFIINIFTVLIYLWISGTGFQYIWSFSKIIQQHFIWFATVGYFSFHILFIRNFFAIEFKYNIFQKILKYLFITSAIIVVISIAIQIIYKNDIIPFKYTINTIIAFIFIYTSVVFLLIFASYKESKRREIIWIAIAMLLHVFNWFILINYLYGSINYIHKIATFQLMESHIFVSHLNILFALTEILIITLFIAYNYHFLIRQNNLSIKRLDYLQKRNINTFVLGQEDERAKITTFIEASVMLKMETLKNQIEKFEEKYIENKIANSVIRDLENTINDLKNITQNYVTPDLQNMLFIELINTATEKLNEEKEVIYEFNNINDTLKLNAIANAHIFRVCQELSNNIFKHANATQIKITTKIVDTKIIIRFIDDGVGFKEKNNIGLGLLNVESRIKSLNGNIHFSANTTNGSTVNIILNLNDIS